MLDTLQRGWVANAYLTALAQGAFLTYLHTEDDSTRMLWLGADGQVTHELAVDVPRVIFVYDADPYAGVVTVSIDPFTVARMFELYRWLPGAPPVVDTLLALPPPETEIYVGAVVDFSAGRLALFGIHLLAEPYPLVYRLYPARFEQEQVTLSGHWDVGPMPDGAYTAGWSAGLGADGNGVVGCFVQGDTIQSVRLQAFDVAGQPRGPASGYRLPGPEAAGGLALELHAGTVYSFFVTFATSDEQRGGAYLVGMPEDSLLNSRERLPLQPLQLQLAAWPNPFNSSVRIHYEVRGLGIPELRVFDLLGREVAALPIPAGSRQGELLWQPATGLASGTYYVQLRSPAERVSRRLLLIR